MNKKLIKQRFGRKLKEYNSHAKIQKQMAEKLMQFLEPKKYDSVLEIGCGTGLLTDLMNKNSEFSKYRALDIVEECENYIKKINPEIEFISSDIEEYIEKDGEKYNLIISNASLQWIENLPEFIKKLAEKLTPNGTLLFSAFGKENFREIYNVYGTTLNYYSPFELKEMLSPLSCQAEEEIRVVAFKTPKDVLKHIQNTGVNALSAEVWTKKDLSDFENLYNNFCANRPTLTYNPLYVIIKK